MTRSSPRVADVGVGAALVGLGQAEVWLTMDASVAAAAITLLGTLPLIWRRLAPEPVLVLCVVALTLLTVRRSDEFAVAQLLGLMLGSYTIAANRAWRRAAIWLGVLLAAALANSASAGSRAAGDYLFPLILLGVPWAAGSSIRVWRARTEELRELTAALEAEREAHARLAVAAERGRIARDLHDSVAQLLNAVVIHAEAAEEALDRDPQRVVASLRRIQAVARSSLAQTRQLLAALRADEAGEPRDLRIDQLHGLVKELLSEGLIVDLDITGDGREVPGSVEAAVFRIVQESLTNVSRHSHSEHARVAVHLGEDVVVTIRDGGPPRTPRPGHGLGLIGMRERAQLLGGRFTAGGDGGGFVVEAVLPTKEHR